MRKTMILDGNSKVGSGKVYETAKELQQSKELEQLQNQLKEAEIVIGKLRIRLDSVICDCEEYRNSQARKLIEEYQTKYMNKSGEA